MSLRLRLALALTFAALLPLAGVAGLLLLQADRRAGADAVARLERAKRQAALLVGRQQRDLRARVARAAADLAADRGAARPLAQGPASAARALARRLADRHALDLIEIRGADGALLATSAAGAAPAIDLDPDGLVDGGVVLAALPIAPLAPPPLDPPEAPPAGAPAPDVILAPSERDGALPGDGPGGSAAAAAPGDRALVSRATVTLAGERYAILGATAVGAPFLEEVAAFTGGPAALIGPDGVAIAVTGEPAGTVIAADVGLAPGGWAVRLAVPAGDAARVRRDLLGVFGGVAPLALAGALAIGVLLAAGIARPIRALAARVDALAHGGRAPAARQAVPLTTVRDPDEVRGLTREFDAMVEGLAESERQRIAAERAAAWQEVARRVAHEVRNALSPIGLAVENLRRTRTRAPAEMDRALEVETAAILEEVGSLGRLVDEFSRFARLPAPQCAPCDLGEVVGQALAHMKARIEACGAEVRISGGDTPHRVVADADQVGRAVKNIVANALDALESAGGPRARRIEVTLASAPAAGVEEIVVRDSGPGLPPEALRRLFEPYFTTRGERGGTGLGMAIVHRIVMQHGGRVAARNAAGMGAEITVRLPVGGPESGGAAGDDPPAPRPAAGGKA